MKTISMFVIAVIFVAIPGATVAQAEGQSPRATKSIWGDLFGGPAGVVAYPQYGWSLKTDAGIFSGYGFVEVAPKEPFFTNHLVVFTPRKFPQFSVHTETGGIPLEPKGFFQFGPRLNIHEVISVLKKPLHHLFVVALPHIVGIRPNNFLVAGTTNRFKVVPKLQMSVDGYRRFFGDGQPDYSEYWLLVHLEKTKHFSFGIFVLHHGRRALFSAGIRVSQ